MKKVILSLMLILFASTLSLWAQKKSDAHITGHVLHAVTQEHLPYINIVLEGTTISTVTDASGHYVLRNLPVGEAVVRVFSMGYATQTKEIALKAGETIELNFLLEEDVIMLDNVVISANKNETDRKHAPTIVNVISPKVFDQTQASCLADGLSFQPGLRLESNCQNCGFQQVRINGLEGTYSQILIDSRAVTSALAGVYGLEQIPVNMIERVEVVRGGGSAIFGSNAVAGTINIITKEPLLNSVSISNTTGLIGLKTIDNITNLNATVVSANNKAGLTLFGSARQRGAYDANEDGFSEIGKVNAKSIGFRGYLRTSNISKLSLEYHLINEFRRGGNKFDLLPHETDITEQTEHDIHSGSVKYDIYLKGTKHALQVYSSFQHIARDSYYGAGKDPNAYGNTTDLASVSGVQYVLNMNKFLFLPATLTTGVEYNYNILKDNMIGYGRKLEQTISIYSAFLQNEWKNKNWTILLGARLDAHNLIKNPIVSPRANIRYSPIEGLALRLGYASGFRAPQAFDEDLHITAVGGEVTFIELDPELQVERSNSLNFSVEWSKKWTQTPVSFLAEGFYTDLNHVFILEENGHDDSGNLRLLRTNGSGAVVAGINLEGRIIPIKALEIQMGFTWQQSLYKKPEVWSPEVPAQRKMFRSPDTYGFVTALYSPLKNLDLSLSAVYTGKMLLQHFAGYVPTDREETSPAFFDMGFKVAYDIKMKENIMLQINGGIKNIFNSYQRDFDQGEFRDAGYIYGPTLPRSVYLGVKFSI